MINLLNFSSFVIYMFVRTFSILALVAVVFSQACCDLNQIKVSGNAQVKVKPDVATIDVGAEAQQSTTLGALQSLNQKINQIIKIIEAQGILKKDYSTSSLSLSQVYENRNGQSVLVGQRASQTLSVKIRDLTNDGAAIGKLITAVSQVKGSNVNGVSFDQTDRKLGVRTARKKAFQSAQKKAEEYAALSGLRIRRVNRIEAVTGGFYTPFFANRDAFALSASSLLVPVRDVSISENVNVWFETI